MKRTLALNNCSCQRKKFRESDHNSEVTNDHREYVENALMMQTTWRLEENKLRNLLLFLSHLESSLFRGHEGRYIVISNGEVWPTSFVSPDDVVIEDGMSVFIVPLLS